MNSIFKHNLINIDVFACPIKDVDNEKIISEINDYSEEIDKKFKDSYLKTHNHTHYEDRKYPKTKECEKLKLIISNKVDEVLNKKMKIESIWTLTLNKGQSVSYHSHKSNSHLHPIDYYSVAYYPSAPNGSANLLFHTTAFSQIDSISSIKPETGMLLIFNSFIPHMTDRHNSPIPRVVVSANFSPINPNTKVVPDWSAYDV
jgi:hypothetical protein